MLKPLLAVSAVARIGFVSYCTAATARPGRLIEEYLSDYQHTQSETRSGVEGGSPRMTPVFVLH